MAIFGSRLAWQPDKRCPVRGAVEPFHRFARHTLRARHGRRAVTRVTVNQRELVERAQRGDHDAFAMLAGASIARLDAAARMILRDQELARGAVQEGVIRAWRTQPTIRGAA